LQEILGWTVTGIPARQKLFAKEAQVNLDAFKKALTERYSNHCAQLSSITN
jgi:hypothetical protein